MKQFIAILAMTVFSIIAWAYVPSTKLVLTKAGINGGQGAYRIDQDVQFFGELEDLQVTESWTILDGNNIRLNISGQKQLKDQFNLQILYKDGRRYSINENGERTAAVVPTDFIDSLFLYRSRAGLGGAMVQMHLASGQILRDRTVNKSAKSVDYQPESFLSLSRLGTDLAFLIADPVVQKGTQKVGVWLDQDSFAIRQIQTQSGAALEANEYVEHPRGFRLPNRRTLKWDTKIVQTRVIKVTAYGPEFEGKKTFDMATFDGRKDNKLKAVWPDSQIIRDFYARFR
jgi:hypothetical protein